MISAWFVDRHGPGRQQIAVAQLWRLGGRTGLWPRDRRTGGYVPRQENNRRRAGPSARSQPVLPYLSRYRGLAIGAAVSLTVAAAHHADLALAVRRMIDHGFSSSDSGFINTYFSMLMVLAVVLALASAARITS